MTRTRDKLIEVLVEVGEQYPDWRLGQTIANFAFLRESLLRNRHGMLRTTSSWKRCGSTSLRVAASRCRGASRPTGAGQRKQPDVPIPEIKHQIPNALFRYQNGALSGCCSAIELSTRQSSLASRDAG